MRTLRISGLLAGIVGLAGAALLIAPGYAQEQLPWQDRAPSESARGGGDANRESGRFAQQGTYDRYGDRYVPDDHEASRSDTYRPGDAYRGDRRDDGPYQPERYADPPPPSDYGYGEPYRDVPRGDEPYDPDYGARDDYARTPPPGPVRNDYYEEGEIVAAGHRFFGSISQGLAKAVEYVFRRQGRPNGYILGEDAGGAFVVGLRYGEGQLYTKDAGTHRVFWQGPSLGYDAGAEGSKTMVLVYNLRDISDMYHRFGGVQGSFYVIGGVSVQFQKHGEVTLAVLRSGVGLRVGANVGYLKYTRSPTWNPL